MQHRGELKAKSYKPLTLIVANCAAGYKQNKRFAERYRACNGYYLSCDTQGWSKGKSQEGAANPDIQQQEGHALYGTMQAGGIAVRSFIREKKIYCGKQYMEVDIYPQTRTGPVPRGRGKKKQVSAPKQRNLNDKNAKRYFTQLVNSNFEEGDLLVTVTYAQLPATYEEAEKEAANYIRRISHRRKKMGLNPLKYVMITEFKTKKDGEKPVRVHHHIIMNGGLDRNEVENLWRKPKKKGQKQGDRIGFVNTKNLQPNDYGLEALSRYLTKGQNGKKRWSSSHNLERPEYRNNDHKYTRRQVERIVRDEIDNQTYWEKQYPGWTLTKCKPEYNDITGWAIYLKLRKVRI